MEYLLTFLEGIITFISPCLLPMIPIYVLYFAGEGEQKRSKTLANALGFVLGFTLVFLLLGAFAGTLGSLVVRYQRVVNLVAGCIVVLFGLYYLGLFDKLLRRGGRKQRNIRITGFFSAVLFGVVFSISWTPCVGAFLGSALMLASVQGSVLSGILLLLCYSAGLGIPFVLSAVLIEYLKGAFDFIKKHYTVINRVCGAFLVAMGVLMATGLLGRWLSALSWG